MEDLASLLIKPKMEAILKKDSGAPMRCSPRKSRIELPQEKRSSMVA